MNAFHNHNIKILIQKLGINDSNFISVIKHIL